MHCSSDNVLDFFLAQLVSRCKSKLYLHIFLSNVHDKLQYKSNPVSAMRDYYSAPDFVIPISVPYAIVCGGKKSFQIQSGCC